MTTEYLDRMKSMSLRERTVFIRHEFGTSICHRTLWGYYKNHNIRFKTVDLYTTRKLLRAAELRQRQRQFVIELEQLKHVKYVWFMDSCSVNVWAHLKRKTWTNDGVGLINGQLSRVTLPLQARRGRNRTIFGVIGAHVGRVERDALFRAHFLIT